MDEQLQLINLSLHRNGYNSASLTATELRNGVAVAECHSKHLIQALTNPTRYELYVHNVTFKVFPK